MNTELVRIEIKWNDRNLLARSVLVGLILLVVLWCAIKRVEPPEGYVFMRLPSISGIYKCGDAGGRYSKSWVGGVGVNCHPISYFEFLGTNRNDCGFKEELSGREVQVVRVITPSAGARSPLVVNISSNNKILYDLSDQRLRELWIGGSISGALTISFILSVIFHAAQMIFVTRDAKKGEKK